MKKHWRIISATGAVLVLAGLVAVVGYLHCSNDRIYDFDPDKDTAGIMSNFKEDWYWLIAEGLNFDVPYMLNTRSPNREDPAYYGKLFIKVIRRRGTAVAFTTYYKKSPQLGWIQFVSVSRSARGKGYGRKLTKYAMNELIKMGCTQIRLVTRTNNIWAQRIYTGLGFRELSRDDKFIDFIFKH